MTVFYLELRPPEVAVEACPEAATVAAVEDGVDSAVAGEGTDVNAIYGQQFLYKNCNNSPQTASPTQSPSSEKTQLNVENEFISSEISQNKESAVERGSKIIIVKKTACVDKRI